MIEIRLRKVSSPENLPKVQIQREITPKPVLVDLDTSTEVSSRIHKLEVLLLNPKTKAEGLGRLQALPTSYLLSFQFDKAGIASNYLIKNRLATSEKLLDITTKAIIKHASSIEKKETERGLGSPGRLTFGGIFNPGIKKDYLIGETNSFATHSVSEAFLTAARAANQDLQKIFPHLLKTNRKNSYGIREQNCEVQKLRILSGCCPHPHDLCVLLSSSC